MGASGMPKNHLGSINARRERIPAFCRAHRGGALGKGHMKNVRLKYPRADHCIGGVVANMTQAQADRWNTGETTMHDLRTVPCWDGSGTEMKLRRAWSFKSRTFDDMNGMPAERIGAWMDALGVAPNGHRRRLC